MRAGSNDERHGAQVERTVLSWNRVAIAVAANGALLMRSGFVHDLVAVEALGLVIAIAGFVLWGLSMRRYSVVAGRPAPHLFSGRSGAVTTAAALVALLSLVELGVVAYTG